MDINMRKQQSLLAIHTAVLLFGIAGLFGKWLSLSPFIIVFGRVFFASAALSVFFLITRAPRKSPARRDFWLLALLGIILAIHWTSFFKSIQVSSVSIGLLAFATYPVFTTFLEPLFFKEKLMHINVAFSCFCALGVFLIIPRFNLVDTTYQGVLWGTLAGVTFAVLTILNRRLTQIYSSLLIAFYQNFIATLVLLPFFLVMRPTLNLYNISLLIILGVFCTAGSHSLFIHSMKQIKAQTASIIHSLEPVYGIIFAFIFLKETPTLRTLTGGAIILFAQGIISYRLLIRGES